MKRIKKSLAQVKKRTVVLGTLLIMLVLAQAAALIDLNQQVTDLRRLNNDRSQGEFRRLAQTAAEMLYSDIVVEPKEQKIYIPELRVRMPLDAGMRKLVYYYLPGDESGAPEMAHISFAGAYTALTDSRAGLDKLTCGRIIDIRTAAEPPEEHRTVKEVPLQDGRTLYLHIVDKATCGSFVSGKMVDDVVSVVSRTESY